MAKNPIHSYCESSLVLMFPTSDIIFYDYQCTWSSLVCGNRLLSGGSKRIDSVTFFSFFGYSFVFFSIKELTSVYYIVKNEKI